MEADDISIADDPAFSKTPFLKASSLQAQVDLGTLIKSRKLSVTGITITKPEIALIQAVKGTWNISSLGAAAENAPKPPPEPAASSKIDLVVHDLKITDGKVTLMELTTQGVIRRELDKVALEISEFSADSSFPFKFSGRYVTGGDLTLNGKAGPISDKDASMTPAQTHFKITGFDLSASGVLDASTGLKGILGGEGDLNWRGTAIDGKGTVRIDKAVLSKGGKPAPSEIALDFDTTHDVVKHTGLLRRGTVHLGKAVANLSGNYNIQAKVPAIAVRLTGSKLPLDELTAFLPSLDIQLPKGSSIKGGNFNIEVASSGPLSELVTKGSFDVENTTLQSFDLGGKMKTVESLAGIKEGVNTQFQTISAKLEQTNQGTTLESLSVVAPAIGDIGGAGTIGADKSLALKMKVNLHAGGLIEGGIPFTVAGTTSDPIVRPDVGAAAKAVVKGTATKLGKDLLNGFLNPKKADNK